MTNNQNERKLARKALHEVLSENRSLSHIKTELTPFAQNLCFGVCRHYFRLDALAKQLLKKPPKNFDIWLTLLIGLYQLRELDLPHYAVVHETVALLNTKKTSWAKSLINAVLRKYCREKDVLDKQAEQSASFRYNYPLWLLKRLQKAWPDHWEAMIAASDAHPPMSLRVNQQRASLHGYQEQLENINICAAPITHTTHGLVLDKPCDVFDLPGFKTGDVSVQDGAAQLAAQFLELKPGLRVLDACCAPGGKTCHILETEPHLKACVALDIEPKRLKRTRENLARLGFESRIQLLAGDAQNPDSWWDGILFDRILLDAPCSATGVIRRHPDIKLLRTAEDVQAITQTQATLLETLWPLLAPGGILVYATCSILPEENEKQIAAFINQHTNAQISPDIMPWGHATGHGWQIFPGEASMDGFFYSVLHKI
ncbi:MAG: 16S rRNA (cytosine(967)-C(5))-methyltransferase RsmB [Legionellaceae bacterium]|jgi:16S rRNA (cytosine967-C5)-methyltransferase|nr:16S rRNA (cytosine(967)-C(5))-methyltransferase RsmB [Legionellaceae bacterium]